MDVTADFLVSGAVLAAVALRVRFDRRSNTGFLIFQKASTTGMVVKVVLEVGVILCSVQAVIYLLGYYCDGQNQYGCPGGKIYNPIRRAQTRIDFDHNLGSYCPPGSANPLPCPAGSFCPPNFPYPITCPAGTALFIPVVLSVVIIGNYCPSNSALPIACAPGRKSTVNLTAS